jgi:hypothetical protein
MKIFLVLFIFFFSFLPLQAQVSAPFDTARMERDLDIMNVVLDRLVFNVPAHFARLGSGSTKGIYLPDYGVIFLMSNPNSAFAIYSVTENVRRLEQELAQQQKIRPLTRAKAGEGRSAAYAYRTENTQELKTTLMEFFSKYADAIGQLDDSERIAVYTSGGGNALHSFSVSGQTVWRSGGETGSEDVMAVARKADIVALRSGKLKADDFTSRVIFKNIETEAASSEIDIMARIIDTALQGRTREPAFHTNNSYGIYLDDFGAIFFTNATFGRELQLQVLQELARRELEASLRSRVTELQTASEQRRESWTAQYKKFKQQLSEVIADYGHTLRQLKPQDNIVITADLDNAPDNSRNYLICRTKKQHIDAFNARRITREQLLKLISYTEY